MAYRAIGYVRVSTEEQSKEGVSLDAQTEKLKQYAALDEIELVEIIRDEGQSAKTLERPGLQKALRMLRDGEADGLLIAKLDRLTRSVRDLATLLDGYFGEKGKHQLSSVAEKIDTRTAAGRMILNILMSVAQWEREAIAERTRDALRHKVARGERVGRPCYGYALLADGTDAKGKTRYRLEEHPQEQAGIKRMREWRAFGFSLREICTRMDAEGFPTKDGKPWQAATVKKILDRRQ